MREISIYVSDPTLINNIEYRHDKVFAGYDGENESTQLNITFHPDFATWTPAVTLDDVALASPYLLPAVTKGIKRLEIETSLDGAIYKSPTIYLEIL